MKVSGDLIEFIKLHHCIVSFRGSNHICYSKFNTAQKTAAKTVCFYIPPPSPVQYKKEPIKPTSAVALKNRKTSWNSSSLIGQKPFFFLVLNIETKGKTPPYFHQGMFLCALVILIHDKVDNDLKIASSSCRHVFIFVKSIKSNILVKMSLTPKLVFFFRRPPLGLTLQQRHVIW